MIKVTNRIAAFAGVLMLTGTVAFAQEMKVDVPFTFHTPTATMAPGTYTITHVPSGTSTIVYRVRNAETRKTILVVAPTPVARKAGEKEFAPKVDFQCAGEYCALAAIYRPANPNGDSLPVNLKNAPRGEKVAGVTIPARP
jgi:hypothetical protein